MFQAIARGYIGVNNLDLNHRIWQIIRRMWRHNRLDAQLQVGDRSVSEPKTEYIGITSKGLRPNLSGASRSCDWNVGIFHAACQVNGRKKHFNSLRGEPEANK